MSFNFEKATKLKEIIETNATNNLINYSQKAFPNECCGFLLETGAIIPAFNAIDTLNNQTLSSRNAFLIDAESWQRAISTQIPISCIYHSHTNGDSNMSEVDKHTLRWQDLSYLVIGIIDSHVVSAKLYWWEEQALNELNISI